MITANSGRNFILNNARIYTLQDKISEQPISLFSTSLTTSKKGVLRQIHPGRCYDFLGTNEYVEVSDHDDFSFGDGSTDQPFSITLWVNMDDQSLSELIMKENEWRLTINNADDYTFNINDDDGIGNITTESAASTEGSWVFVAATYDAGGIASGLKIYENGILLTVSDSTNNSYTATGNKSTSVFIGSWEGTATYADGKMHDVRIHSKELSKKEVWETMYGRASGYETGWWKMEEGAGDISFDSSGRGHHGTVENATLSTFHVSSSTLPKSFLNDGGYSGGRYHDGTGDIHSPLDSCTDLNPGTVDYSIDGWFFNTSAATTRCIVSKGGGSPTTEGYYIWLNTSNILTTRHSDGTNQHQAVSVAAVPYGWNYFCMVVDRDYAVQQYLNQLDVVETTQDEQIDVQPNILFSIGSYTGGSNYMDAFIGTIRYTARALTQAEVRDTYNNGFSSDTDTVMIAQLDDYGKYIDIVGDRYFHYGTTEAVYIPRDESNTSMDVSGEQLKHYGDLKYNIAASSMCADFDGTSAYVNVPDDDLLSFGNGSTDEPFSVSAWIKADDYTNFYIIKKDRGSFDDTGREWLFNFNASDQLFFSIFDETNNGYRQRYNDTGYSSYDGEWMHVAATYSGIGGTSAQNGIKIYVNSERIDNNSTTSGTYTAMSNGTRYVEIGASGAVYSDGSICDARVYDVELSKSNIEDIMLGNQNRNEIAWYPLMEGNGEVAHDVSGNNLHGTVTGATLSNFWGQTQTLFQYNNRMGFSDGLYFNGSDALAQVASDDFNPHYGDWSMGFVFQTYVTGLDTWVIDKQNIVGWGVYVRDTNVAAFYMNDTVNGVNYTYGTSNVADGNIHYVEITADRTGNVTIYVDGVYENSESIAHLDDDVTSVNDFRIARSTSSGTWMEGNIYAVRYSNKVRTADEVFSSYKYGFTNDPDTVALWDFKDGLGINVTDENSNNLTLTNTAQVRMPALSTDLKKDVLGHTLQHLGGGLNGSESVIDFTGGVAAPIWNDCRLGYVELNGTDDEIDCGDHDDLSFLDTDGDLPFSISAWINMDDATHFSVVSKDNTSTIREWFFGINNSDYFTFVLFDSAADYIGRQYQSSTMTKYEGEWVHICCTYDGGEVVGGMKLYLNNVQVDDTDLTLGTYDGMSNTAYVVQIGNRGSGLFADGKIRDVHVFNIELTQSQISEDYKTGRITPATISDSPMIRNFRLSKDAYDASINRAHGEILGTNINFPKATVDTSYEQGDYLAYPFYKKNTDNIVIEATAATYLYMPFNRVYGIWEFDFYKDNDAGSIYLHLISDRVDVAGNWSIGYDVRITSAEELALNESNGTGIGSLIMSTSSSPVILDTWHKLTIVRNSTTNEYVGGNVGTFSVYLDGNLVTVTVGNNPATDNTVTVNRYMLFYFSASGDKIRNFTYNGSLVNLSKFQVDSGSYKIYSDKESSFVSLKRPLMAQALSRPVFRYTRTGESNA